jgi:Family of unknown function (DUF6506)
MAFKTLFIAHTPDADPDKHRVVLETGKYKLTTVLVRNQAQALELCRNMVKGEGIHSVLLCPGFSHKDIAEIAEAVGPKVGVSVARGDGPSGRVTAEVFRREGWFA